MSSISGKASARSVLVDYSNKMMSKSTGGVVPSVKKLRSNFETPASNGVSGSGSTNFAAAKQLNLSKSSSNVVLKAMQERGISSTGPDAELALAPNVTIVDKDTGTAAGPDAELALAPNVIVVDKDTGTGTGPDAELALAPNVIVVDKDTGTGTGTGTATGKTLQQPSYQTGKGSSSTTENTVIRQGNTRQRIDEFEAL